MNHCLLRAQVTMMQHTVWVFCAANTKLQFILIIEGCVESVKHKFYILMLGGYTYIVQPSNTNRHAPLWLQESKSIKSNFQTWKFCLKTAIYFRNIGQRKSLRNLLFWTIFVSDANTFLFYLDTYNWHHLSHRIQQHIFLFLYLILLYSSWKRLLKSLFLS